jgi:hypothetical protein
VSFIGTHISALYGTPLFRLSCTLRLVTRLLRLRSQPKDRSAYLTDPSGKSANRTGPQRTSVPRSSSPQGRGDYIDSMADVPQIAADLLQRQVGSTGPRLCENSAR